MDNPEELVRTQTSLRERQRQFLKYVAKLATYRIRNDDDMPFTLEDESRVSMAEVLRLIVDERIYVTTTNIENNVFYPPDGDPDHGARSSLICHCVNDVTRHISETMMENPMAEVPRGYMSSDSARPE